MDVRLMDRWTVMDQQMDGSSDGRTTDGWMVMTDGWNEMKVRSNGEKRKLWQDNGQQKEGHGKMQTEQR